MHIYSWDTDVFILGITKQPQLGPEASIIVSTGSRRRIIALRPIYDTVGRDIAECLPGFHSFTGTVTSGKFAGKGKQTCWTTLKQVGASVLQAFKLLRIHHFSKCAQV